MERDIEEYQCEWIGFKNINYSFFGPVCKYPPVLEIRRNPLASWNASDK
jgi:hypothetical protein